MNDIFENDVEEIFVKLNSGRIVTVYRDEYTFTILDTDIEQQFNELKFYQEGKPIAGTYYAPSNDWQRAINILYQIFPKQIESVDGISDEDKLPSEENVIY